MRHIFFHVALQLRAVVDIILIHGFVMLPALVSFILMFQCFVDWYHNHHHPFTYNFW